MSFSNARRPVLAKAVLLGLVALVFGLPQNIIFAASPDYAAVRPALSGVNHAQSGAVSSPGVTLTAHPRLILDAPTLTTLRQKATANHPAWTELKGRCDQFLPGQVLFPTGSAYPSSPNIGRGYQGDTYFEHIMNYGLCYQIAKTVAPALAPAYAAKGVHIITQMSTPGQLADPLFDQGYGIRNYGVGMAFGYDWFYDVMTPTARTQVYTELNRWISQFESGGLSPNHPHANYFAGYYAAKGLAALATEGDNPLAPAQWDDWLNRLHKNMVVPYYSAHLTGGGWSEGWNYGPGAMINLNWPVLAVRTAKGLDLVNQTTGAFSYLTEAAAYIMHFAWPNRLSMDDRSLLYAGDNSSATDKRLFAAQAWFLQQWQPNNAFNPVFREYARQVNTLQTAFQGYSFAAWPKLLFDLPTNPNQSLDSVPFSYFAAGLNMVAMRSSWLTDAVWASFTAGYYVNNPNVGEQFFDQGSLAIVRGGVPLLVNATGALGRHTPGTQDGKPLWELMYNDTYGGNRTLFNIFYSRPLNEPNVKYGQDNFGPGEVQTEISRYEDGESYVYMRGVELDDMYRKKPDGSPMMTGWTRDVVYLRPDLFVIYDRTKIPNTSYDQWQAFHLPKTPVPITSTNGTHRYDVSGNGAFAGSVTTLFPENHAVNLVNVFNSNKIYRLEVRPKDGQTEQQWLTILDAANAPGKVATTQRFKSSDGRMLGVVLENTRRYAVLAGIGANGESITGPISYAVAAKMTRHVITGLPTKTAYTVRVTNVGGEHRVQLTPTPPGVKGLVSTGAGVLTFDLNDQGVIMPQN
jgi:hypothetical protein